MKLYSTTLIFSFLISVAIGEPTGPHDDEVNLRGLAKTAKLASNLTASKGKTPGTSKAGTSKGNGSSKTKSPSSSKGKSKAGKSKTTSPSSSKGKSKGDKGKSKTPKSPSSSKGSPKAPTMPPTPMSSEVIVQAFREDPTSQARGGVLVFVDDNLVGTTGSNGDLMVNLVPGQEYKIRALEVGLVGGTTLFIAEDPNEVLPIVMKGDEGVSEEAALQVSALENSILDISFDFLSLSFVRSSGDTAPLSFFDYVFLESPQDSDSRVQVTDFFELNDATKEIVLVNIEDFRTLLAGLTFGEAKIEAYGEDANGLVYSDVLGFFVASAMISGTLVAPPSNPTLKVDGLEVEASFLVSPKVSIKKAFSDATGSFSFPVLPAGNWELTATTKSGDQVYNAFATFLSEPGSNTQVDMVLRTTEDILNNVPPFSVSTFRRFLQKKQVDTDRAALHEAYLQRQRPVQAIPFKNSASVSVVAGTEGAAITDSASLTVPMGTEKVVLKYTVSSAEYPFYVLSQSIFNDVWSLNLVNKNGGQLFQISRQVNSMIFVQPFFQSDGSTGLIEMEFDVSAFTMTADTEIVISASATNIGDSILPTSVQATIDFTSALRINEMIADTVVPTKGDSSYYSIPRPSSSNTNQRTYTLKISRPDMTMITRVTAKLVSGSTELATIVDEAPGGVLVTEENTETLKVTITNTGSNPSMLSSTPPQTHNFVYRFKVEGELDGETISDQKDTNPRKALWKLPDVVPRKGYRDPGGDGWCSKGTYEWLITNKDRVPRVDDISGEHSRDIGHTTHFRGTDLDTFHFTDLTGGSFNGNDNIIKLSDAVKSALEGSASAKASVKTWMTDSRTGLDNLAALNTVASMIYHRGSASGVLKGGWAKDLLTTGKVTDTMGRTLNLEIGTWSQAKVTQYRNDHNNHLHIDLNDSALNNSP